MKWMEIHSCALCCLSNQVGHQPSKTPFRPNLYWRGKQCLIASGKQFATLLEYLVLRNNTRYSNKVKNLKARNKIKLTEIHYHSKSNARET